MPIPQFTAGQVLTAAELNAMVDAINAGGAVKVERFTTSGTWTVPAGVTYAVAYIRGGGGGMGISTGGAGGTSSVAFASGTVSATGGNLVNHALVSGINGAAGVANSGEGARGGGLWGGASQTSFGAGIGGNGALITAGAEVTPAASITVTIGAGGAGLLTGGSGYVYIEYQGG